MQILVRLIIESTLEIWNVLFWQTLSCSDCGHLRASHFSDLLLKFNFNSLVKISCCLVVLVLFVEEHLFDLVDLLFLFYQLLKALCHCLHDFVVLDYLALDVSLLVAGWKFWHFFFRKVLATPNFIYEIINFAFFNTLINLFSKWIEYGLSLSSLFIFGL